MGTELNKSLELSLSAGLQKLNLNLSPKACEQLMAHLLLLQKWNKAYNLTAIHDLRAMLGLHVFDSLAIAPYVKGSLVLDVGSGAGFPGIPLAIALPEWEFVLLDSNRKKTAFLTHVTITLGLKNVKVVNMRVEDFHFAPGFVTIVTRATMLAKDIIAKIQHLHWEQLLVMKGKLPQEELKDIPNKVVVTPLKVPGVDAERHLVQIQAKDI